MMELTKDPWLSEILEREAYRASVRHGDVQVDRKGDRGDSPLSHLAPRSFVYAKVPTGDLGTLRRYESCGLRVVETTLTFEVPCSSVLHGGARGGGIGISVRDAHDSDRDSVMRVAGASFVYSRFHEDPHLLDHAHVVKAEWAGNFFRGKRGDRLLVAERGGVVTGFVQLLQLSSGDLVIDLIAVDEAARGCGVASALIGALGTPQHPGKIRVGTQAHNFPSVRLYEKLGFRLLESSYVLHYHHNVE